MVYPQEFRTNAIKRFEEIGSYWKAARELNVSIATLHRWVKVATTEQKTPPTISQPSLAADLPPS
jgi:transposase-like protein